MSGPDSRRTHGVEIAPAPTARSGSGDGVHGLAIQRAKPQGWDWARCATWARCVGLCTEIHAGVPSELQALGFGPAGLPAAKGEP